MTTYYDPRNDPDRDLHNSQSSESSSSSHTAHESREEVSSPDHLYTQPLNSVLFTFLFSSSSARGNILESRANQTKSTSLSRTQVGLHLLPRRTNTRLRNKRRPSKHSTPKTRQKTRSRKQKTQENMCRCVGFGRSRHRPLRRRSPD